jgi:hypothetical protein
MSKVLIIEQVSNGYLVKTNEGREYASSTVAVFNEIHDLTVWLKNNFRLPEIKDNV